MVRCPICYTPHHPLPRCPNTECGHQYETKGRKIEHIDGELKEINLEMQKRQTKLENWKAGSLDELIALGKERGYKNPQFWALKFWQSRIKKK